MPIARPIEYDYSKCNFFDHPLAIHGSRNIIGDRLHQPRTHDDDDKFSGSAHENLTNRETFAVYIT